MIDIDPIDPVTLREKLARIDQMLTDNARHPNHILIRCDHQEHHWYLVAVLVSSLITGAALFAAGAVFMKLFGMTR
jgi:hypothetical protein